MDQFRILFVCSANLCRSITAAELAQRRIDRSDGTVEWLVESAGTDVRAGNSLPPEIARAMRSAGMPVDRPPIAVNEPLARSADVILTAERHHRAAVARVFPQAVGYTFTLLQFGRLAAAGRAAAGIDAISTGHDLLEVARIGRAHAPPADDDDDDIADPVSTRSVAHYESCVDMIELALQQIFD